jgi:hypothetical protein
MSSIFRGRTAKQSIGSLPSTMMRSVMPAGIADRLTERLRSPGTCVRRTNILFGDETLGVNRPLKGRKKKASNAASPTPTASTPNRTETIGSPEVCRGLSTGSGFIVGSLHPLIAGSIYRPRASSGNENLQRIIGLIDR